MTPIGFFRSGDLEKATNTGHSNFLYAFSGPLGLGATVLGVVASFFGLGIVLLSVGFLYQRFVYAGPAPSAEEDGATP